MVAYDILLAAPPIILMSFGLFVMFRICGELDLSVDATFTTGAAVLALTVHTGPSPWLGLAGSMCAGSLISSVVFLIHRIGKTQYLLASLIVFTGMYSINLHIIGGATVGLIGQPTVFDSLPARGDLPRILLLSTIVLLAALALWAFFNTSYGLALRAAGRNPGMARANRVDTRLTLLVGAVIAGSFFGLAGSLQAQTQGYADITMGIGAIIICVAALFLGELFFPNSGRIAPGLLAVICGGLLYSTILTLALRSGLPPVDLRLATAGILVVAVLLSRQDVKTSLRRLLPSGGKAHETNRHTRRTEDRASR